VISPALQALLDPLEEFEAIRRRAARLGDRLCDLSYANPYEGVEQSTRQALRRALDGERLLDMQYSPFGGQTLVRRAVADDLASRQAQPYEFHDVILTPGAMAGLHLALRALGGDDDEVVIPVPCWLDYPLYTRYLGLCPMLVPLSASTFELDLNAIADALTARTCAVLLSNPANPTGRSYSSEALAGLASVLEEARQQFGRAITLISDETHRDFTEPGAHHAGATAWPATITVYSFGKYHFIQGQRIGYLAISPSHPERQALSSEIVRWTRVMGFCTPTTHMQAAVLDLLGLQHDLTSVAERRRWLMEELRQSGYQVTPADATLFVYVATPDGEEDMAFIRRIANNGVLALPAPVFHHRGHFRLALTGGARMLEGGVAVLRRVAAGRMAAR
jgi:aspartate aminotransferase